MMTYIPVQVALPHFVKLLAYQSIRAECCVLTADSLSFVVEPELDRNFTLRIIRWQGTKSVNALQGPHCRLIEGRNTTRLLYLHIRRVPIPLNVKRHINPSRVTYARIDLVLEPVLGNFLLHNTHIPGIARTKIPSAASESESTFRAAGIESSVR